MRIKIPEVLIGCLLTISVFMLGYLFDARVSPRVEPSSLLQETLSNPVNIFSGLSTIFSLVLTVATIGLLRATRRAADVSERALVGLERPWLIVEGAKIRLREEYRGHSNSWFISLRLRNVGRMPALVDECQFRMLTRASLPAMPDYAGASPLTCDGMVTANGTTDTGEVGPAPDEIGVKEPRMLVFFGELRYGELNGTKHRTGFALEIAPNMPTYNRLPIDAYWTFD